MNRTTQIGARKIVSHVSPLLILLFGLLLFFPGLKSRFHFSFAEYSNPDNQNFGVLRVMNDDLVQPNRGANQ
jgi:hypothetical protein